MRYIDVCQREYLWCSSHFCHCLPTAFWPWDAGGQNAQQGDRGLVASDSLMRRITITSPDDNHVIITMPIADSTKPRVARSSQSRSNEDDHAAPSDSAYSADALPPAQMSHPQPGAGHDSSPEQWQQEQQQLGRQQAEGQPDRDQLEHTQSQVPHQLAGPGDAISAEHQQAMQQPARLVAASLVPEPSGLGAPGTEYAKQMSHWQQESLLQQQQQEVARSSRSYTDLGRKHLQKRPGQKQPKNESASEFLHEKGPPPASVNLSASQSSVSKASVNNASVIQSNEYEFGHGPELGDEALVRDQQVDALQEQLHGLVQASQGINQSLLRVHQHLELLKSK